MLESPLHENNLLHFTVEIQDKPILNASKTAVLCFFDDYDKRVSVFKLPVMFKEDIYKLIDEKQPLVLSGAYIKDFSLNEYRKLRNLDEDAEVELYGLTAKKTFFDCEMETDFSHAHFIAEKTTFEASIFGNGYCNFFSAHFAKGSVSFKKVKFGAGSINFQSARFGDGNISFHDTSFGHGNVSFIDTDFGNGNVDFKNSYFGKGSVDFKFAKFASGDITFERSVFGEGRKDFKNVEFGGGKIDFKRIDFNDGDVCFEGVEFGDGKVSFRASVFGKGKKTFELADFEKGEAQFDLVDFGTGSISFNQASVMQISFKGCHLDCYTDLRFANCQSVDLSNTVLRDILNVKPEGEKVVIKEMILTDMRILGRLFINWRENNVFDLIYNQQKTSRFQKAEQFRILKENFRNNGQYDDEDDAYLEFKRCEAKARLAHALERKGQHALLAYPEYYFQKYVFDYVGRYATAPMRVLTNAVLAVFVYACIYYCLDNFFPGIGSVASTLPAELNYSGRFWNSVYYSAITFCTVGYGDYFALGWVKLIAAFEGFSGIFLMSYFTVAFVRKILR